MIIQTMHFWEMQTISYLYSVIDESLCGLDSVI